MYIIVTLLVFSWVFELTRFHCNVLLLLTHRDFIYCPQEGANVAHIVGKLDGVMQRLADQRAMAETDGPRPEKQPLLKDRIRAVRNSVDVTAQTKL